MRSGRAKVLHRVGGRPLVIWTCRAVRSLVARTVVVIGHERDAVRQALASEAVTLCVQEKQEGTGHALQCALPEIEGCRTLLVLPGDAPRLSSATLEALLREHERKNAAATVLTFRASDPRGYGRILRARDGTVEAIVEEAQATPEEREITEVSSSAYVFDPTKLLPLLPYLPRRPAGELHLTYAIQPLAEFGTVSALEAPESEALGINTQAQLAAAEALYRSERASQLMGSGVTLVDPATALVDVEAVVAPGTILHPFVTLEGSTDVGWHCEIGPFVRLVDTRVGDGAVVRGPLSLEGIDIPPGASDSLPATPIV